MKKILLLSLALSSAFGAFAQMPSSGYYRVQNVASGRYVVLVDNRGSIDFATTDADLNALRTVKGFETVASNPASVIYAEKYNTREYILYSQGTDTYSIVSEYLRLYDNGDGTYKAYATNSGMTKYLVDDPDLDTDPAHLYTGSRTSETGDWYVISLSSEEGAYFGITPDITVGNDHYKMLYTAFPYSFVSSGMVAYYIDKSDIAADGTGYAELKQLTTDVVPAATPVIVQCSSLQASGNKANPLTSTTSSPSDNLLTGVYFCNDVRLEAHRNVVDYDPTTMRVLGVTSDGSLGMIKEDASSLPYIPANTAYLTVPSGFPSEMKLIAESDYEKVLEEHGGSATAAVTSPLSTTETKPGVYTLSGTKLSDSNTLPSELPAGLYIVGGKKVAVH